MTDAIDQFRAEMLDTRRQLREVQFELNRDINRLQTVVRAINIAGVPVLVAVGEQDPVNGRLALVHGLVERLRHTGLADVTLTVYPGARHEVFNETNRDEVVADLLAWLDRVVPA